MVFRRVPHSIPHHLSGHDIANLSLNSILPCHSIAFPAVALGFMDRCWRVIRLQLRLPCVGYSWLLWERWFHDLVLFSDVVYHAVVITLEVGGCFLMTFEAQQSREAGYEFLGRRQPHFIHQCDSPLILPSHGDQALVHSSSSRYVPFLF